MKFFFFLISSLARAVEHYLPNVMRVLALDLTQYDADFGSPLLRTDCNPQSGEWQSLELSAQAETKRSYVFPLDWMAAVNHIYCHSFVCFPAVGYKGAWHKTDQGFQILLIYHHPACKTLASMPNRYQQAFDKLFLFVRHGGIRI